MQFEESGLSKNISITVVSTESFQEGAGVARIVLDINGKVFRRVFERYLPVCWIDDNTNKVIEGKNAQDLEGIFKSWCFENRLPATVDNKRRIRRGF